MPKIKNQSVLVFTLWDDEKMEIRSLGENGNNAEVKLAAGACCLDCGKEEE